MRSLPDGLLGADLLKPLDRPFELKSLRLRNRFAMAPMTRQFAPDGAPTPDMAAYYARRAEGGVGLIISEGVGLDRASSRNMSRVPKFHGEAPLAGWRRVLQDVHAGGAAMAPQLWHVGGVPDFYEPQAEIEDLESPSGLIGPGVPGGRPMRAEDVADAIASYGRAAAAAKRLGFDAVEVHAAHGYLIDQFFWAETNRRGDRYGGAAIADRARFGAEIMREMRRAVGPDQVLILRVSQWKTGYYDTKIAEDPQALERWLGPLATAGVDIFHCSQRRFWEPEFAGSDLNLAGWVKKVVGAPTITVGSVGLDRDVMSDFEGGESRVNPASLAELARRFDRGDFDLVALGRVLLADPQWLDKVRAGRFGELSDYSAEALSTLF
jgi:2,4-dienoyl-CoA reductase-like NADH-dependent reductase (Old Yellow Enzyme family)